MLSSNHWSLCYIYYFEIVKLIDTLIDCHFNIFFTFQFLIYYYFLFCIYLKKFPASNRIYIWRETFQHLFLKLLLYIIVQWNVFSFFLRLPLPLQMPIREACHVALQKNHPSKHRLWKHVQARQDSSVQGQTPVLQIVCIFFWEVPLCTTNFSGTFFFLVHHCICNIYLFISNSLLWESWLWYFLKKCLIEYTYYLGNLVGENKKNARACKNIRKKFTLFEVYFLCNCMLSKSGIVWVWIQQSCPNLRYESIWFHGRREANFVWECKKIL